MGSRRTRIWHVCKSSHHLRYFPGSAPAFGGALARDDGSDLLSLKLHSFCSRATAFSRPPALRRLTKLCQACFPPRLPHLLSFSPCNGGIFRRFSSAKARLPCWFAVATPTLTLVRSLRFLRGAKLPADSHSARQQFLIATCRGISCSHFRSGATRPGEIREPCPDRSAVSSIPRREPGAPTAPGLSPV